MSGSRAIRAPVRALVLAGVLLLPAAAFAFEGGEVWVSASGGWSRLAPLGGGDRPGVDGGGGGVRVLFVLSDTFGLALEGTATWYQGFAPAAVLAPEGDDEKAAPPADPGPSTTGITCRDLGLTLVYAIDVFALVPQIALGLAVARLSETREDVSLVAWDLALRFDAGLDYRLARRLALGLWATFDTTIAGASPWAGRTAVTLRLTIPFGRGPVSAPREPSDHSTVVGAHLETPAPTMRLPE
ncbi:MAG TPA: hypothetical protein VM285_08560 [Polyangia bacterium]|nr:hypothetical protein [Polyangia bacterium]